MSFIGIATASAKRGLAVYPTLPGERGPCKGSPSGWTTGATTDLGKIKEWAKQWPDYNVVCVSNPATSIALDIDDPELAAKHGFPFGECENTLWVRTPGGGLHIHFSAGKYAIQIDRNRNIKLDGDLAVEYKYRAASVAAPGTVRADGGRYVIERDNQMQPIPLNIITWLLEHSEPVRTGKTRGIPVHEDFDFDLLADFFDVDIVDVSGIWHTPRFCPIKGDWHTSSGKPDFGAVGFAWDEDNRTLGWKDHAQSCDGADMNVKQVIDFLEDQKGEEYPYPLFAEQLIESTVAFPFAEPDDNLPEVADLQSVFPNAVEVSIKPDDVIAALPNKDEVQKAWDTAAEALSQIRTGLGVIKTADGKDKIVKKPQHFVDDEILAYVYTALRDVMSAEFFVDGYPYIFLPMEATIYDLHDDRAVYQILSRLRLRQTQRHYELVARNLTQEIIFRGKRTRIEKFGCMRGDAIYVNNGRGGMIKITEEEFEEVPNGTDGVYMSNRHLLPWPVIVQAKIDEIADSLGENGGRVTNSPLCRVLNAYFEQGKLTPMQYQQLAMLRYLALFLGNIDLRPIMMAIGPQNSGKSTLWEKHMWMFFGTNYMSQSLPPKLPDFITAVTNHQIQLFDNIDRADFNNAKSDYPTYVDMMCKCSTGGKVTLRQLYKDNIDKNYDLRCDLFLTSRTNPFPAHYSDLLRRTLVFPIRLPNADEHRTTESMKREFEQLAEDLKLETLVRLQLILRALIANRTKEWEPVAEMASFETYTMRVADYEGWLLEMRSIWCGYSSEYKERLTEDSPFVNFIRYWLGKSGNAGRWVRSGQMYKELEDRYSKKFTTFVRSDAAFGRKLKENFSALGVLGPEKRFRDGGNEYCFTPNEEQLKQCKNAYEDSLSKWARELDEIENSNTDPEAVL